MNVFKYTPIKLGLIQQRSAPFKELWNGYCAFYKRSGMPGAIGLLVMESVDPL